MSMKQTAEQEALTAKLDAVVETTLDCPLCESMGRHVKFPFLKKNAAWYGQCPECLFRAYAPMISMRRVLEKVMSGG